MSISPSIAGLHYEAQEVFCNTIALVLQSMFYGIHVALMPFAVHLLLKQGRRSRLNVYVVLAMLLPFLLSSAYWGAEFAQQLMRIYYFFLEPSKRPAHSVTPYTTLFNAIILLNALKYLISDGVVVWRAWVICKEDYRRILLVPVVVLMLTSLSIFTTISIRIATFFTAAGPGADNTHPLIRAIDICQVSNLVWSLSTNFSATSIVAHKAWRHRRLIKEGLQNAPNKSTMAERILAMLIESGFLYCISCITILISAMIKLPYGTVGDIYMPVNLQFAGIYPTIVIVLVGLQRSANVTTYWQETKPVIPAKTDTWSAPIQFAKNPSLSNASLSKSDVDITTQTASM